ncbi:hypothetical protein F511_09254 [Dorcoceras hygrometricum]|uniref:Uncharacterized protein n=1 Tax=Dorcoceras hygrometricum TaxID=472368 RepID=A0A2Z7CTS0_9LAMI|nr:hypothetical protein F511_09254 [Dorcoceras hygrometricum]
MDQQMRKFRVTSWWFGKTVKEVERRRFVKLKRCVLEPATRGLRRDWFLLVATGADHSAGTSLATGAIPLRLMSACVYEIVTTQVLLAEPLGSLAFKMVQVRKLVEEQQMSACVYEIVTTQVLLAEPLGSLAFKMVQVRQLVDEQQVKLENQQMGGVVFIQGLRFPCLSCIVLNRL